MNTELTQKVNALLRRLEDGNAFYRSKLNACGLHAIQTAADIANLPFTTKEELREIYPLGLQCVPDEQVVRIHSSSGTTGQPIIIPYTKNDVDVWTELFARCYRMAGVGPLDRVQVTPGYGLWTAGIGFQAGAEAVGAMAVPMGPGNTDKQVKMLVDLQSTVLCAASSYALVIAEKVEELGLKSHIALKRGVIGSERWGDKMRERIAALLDIELFDIYGLTEIYGPGIAIDCPKHQGMHYFDDHLYFEIIDPNTLAPLPAGETGELVITTLTKQGAPLLRYRTHDLTSINPDPCACGLPYPRINRIIGRTDDMVKVKGVNIYPGQIDELLAGIDGVSSEYQLVVDHAAGKDTAKLYFESAVPYYEFDRLRQTVGALFKSRIGISISTVAKAVGELPRAEKKTPRIIDKRQR